MSKQTHVAKYLSDQKGYLLVEGQAISGGRIDDFLEALPNINRDSDIIVHWALHDLYQEEKQKGTDPGLECS